MIWDDWNQFLAMGGYARYVWGAFGTVLAALAVEQLLLRLQRHDALMEARLAPLANELQHASSKESSV